VGLYTLLRGELGHDEEFASHIAPVSEEETPDDREPDAAK